MNMTLLEILPTIMMSHCHCWCCCWEYFHLGLWLRVSIFSTFPVKIAEAFVGGRTNREKEMVRRHKSGSGKVTNQEWTWITNPCNVSPVAGSVITGHLSVRHSRLFVPRRSGGRVWYLYIYLRWPEHVIEIETHNRTQPTNAALLETCKQQILTCCVEAQNPGETFWYLLEKFSLAKDALVVRCWQDCWLPVDICKLKKRKRWVGNVWSATLWCFDRLCQVGIRF